MRWLAASLAVAAVALATLAVRRPDLTAFVARYLSPATPGSSPVGHRSRRRLGPESVPWVVAGGLIGALAAQGDLFLGGPGRSALGLTSLGAAAGWFGFSAVRTTRRERAARSLRFELPVIADALALHIVSGESVASAIGDVASGVEGVAAGELREIVDRIDEGAAVPEALSVAVDRSAHPDSRRLYELLAHAHASGGRLAESLIDLASDYRAALERDLTAESGRRMVATYGPVLVLMVPTALLFLLYPTLLGLRSLSGAP